MSTRRRIPVTSDMVSLWVPSGTGRAIDIIRGNDGQCYGTHPNVPVISGRNIVANGAFTTDDDPPDSWTASNATLSTEAGGLSGNCMKVLDGGAGNGYGYQINGTVVGKVYNFSCWAKDIDTGQNGLIEVGTSAGNATYYSSGAITDDTGVTYTATFTATTTTTFISLNCTSSGGTYYFDSVSLKEQQQLINPSVGWVFDGTNDYVEVPDDDSLDITDAITIGTWVYRADYLAGQEYHCVISKQITAVELYIRSGKLYFHGNRTGSLRANYNIVLSSGWHCVVFRFDKNNVNTYGEYHSLFVDGIIRSLTWVDGADTNTPLSINANPIRIGARDATTLQFDGYIALPFIANRAWSKAQVSNFYNATKGMFSPKG